MACDIENICSQYDENLFADRLRLRLRLRLGGGVVGSVRRRLSVRVRVLLRLILGGGVVVSVLVATPVSVLGFGLGLG